MVHNQKVNIKPAWGATDISLEPEHSGLAVHNFFDSCTSDNIGTVNAVNGVVCKLITGFDFCHNFISPLQKYICVYYKCYFKPCKVKIQI